MPKRKNRPDKFGTANYKPKIKIENSKSSIFSIAGVNPNDLISQLTSSPSVKSASPRTPKFFEIAGISNPKKLISNSSPQISKKQQRKKKRQKQQNIISNYLSKANKSSIADTTPQFAPSQSQFAPSQSQIPVSRLTRQQQDLSEKQAFINKWDKLITEANRRWELIEATGNKSMAIDRASEELGREYFNLDTERDMSDLIKEVTQANVFLRDRTGTLLGAEVYTKELDSAKYYKQFGGSYDIETGERVYKFDSNYKDLLQMGRIKSYNPNIIDEEIAKNVFKNYRNIESLRQADIMEYGSDKLIAIMYDAEVKGIDSFQSALEQLDTTYKFRVSSWEERYNRDIQNELDEYNSDYLKERFF